MTRDPEHPTAPDAPDGPGGADGPHDILAAEEFPGPSPDAAIHEPHVELPPEPDPRSEPHDVLAAEEFAMPAPRRGHELPAAGGAPDADVPRPNRVPLVSGLLAAAGAFAVVLRLRARRASKATPRRRRIGRS